MSDPNKDSTKAKRNTTTKRNELEDKVAALDLNMKQSGMQSNSLHYNKTYMLSLFQSFHPIFLAS